jgi:hypothetical protein
MKALRMIALICLAGLVGYQTQTAKAQTAKAQTANAKHFTDGQSIPGVGTAIGDVYVLPDGRCYGGKSGSGIHFSNGATSIFGATITAQSPILVCNGFN